LIFVSVPPWRRLRLPRDDDGLWDRQLELNRVQERPRLGLNKDLGFTDADRVEMRSALNGEINETTADQPLVPLEHAALVQRDGDIELLKAGQCPLRCGRTQANAIGESAKASPAMAVAP
jgi:hypothetical protein